MQYRYNLYFKSPFNILDSVKISGALSSAAYKLFPDKKSEITDALTKCNLKVSDQFPFDEKNNSPLLPVPLLPYSMPRKLDRDQRIKEAKGKKESVSFARIEPIKRLFKQFIEEGITRRNAMEILKEKDNENELTAEAYNEASEYGVNLLEEEPKVYVKELEKIGNLQMRKFGQLEFLSYDPVYFLADYSMKEFSISMAFLEDAGLSGMFTRGKGHFFYQRNISEIETGFKGSGYYMILSKYCPSKSDITNIDLEKSYYSLGTFTGIGNGNIDLQKIRYFKAGSLLYLEGAVEGRSVITKNEERILSFSTMVIKVG